MTGMHSSRLQYHPQPGHGCGSCSPSATFLFALIAFSAYQLFICGNAELLFQRLANPILSLVLHPCRSASLGWFRSAWDGVVLGMVWVWYGLVRLDGRR
jgi:hypothetical protein